MSEDIQASTTPSGRFDTTKARVHHAHELTIAVTSVFGALAGAFTAIAAIRSTIQTIRSPINE